MDPSLLDPVIDVHLKGAFNVTRPRGSRSRAGYGRIVSTASAAGIFGNFGQSNYGAAKMGLVGFTRVLAVEGAKYNIKANVIAPLAHTRMTEDIIVPPVEGRARARVAGRRWLVHEVCPVSGEVYSVAGGRVARIFIAETPGYYNPALTLEDVRDNWDTIRDEAGYIVPASIADGPACT